MATGGDTMGGIRGCGLALALAFGLGAAGSPARAAGLEETVPVEPGGTLHVELDVGSVDVESHDDPEVEIDADASGLGGADFELRREGDELHLIGRVEGFWSFLAAHDVRVRARVPRRFSVRIETRGGRIDVEELEGRVDAETSGGSIDADRIEGRVTLHTSGGSIDATEIRGDLRAETTGGSIRVEEVAGDVEARTAGGSIAIEDVDGAVDAQTMGGSVSASWRGAPEGSLRTTGGGVEVELPPGAGAQLRARTTGGSVSIDEELGFSGARERERADGTLGGGGALLELRTLGGSVHVRRR
jgi:DUF4097 and DUF4098 domain-containing protein YvlB